MLLKARKMKPPKITFARDDDPTPRKSVVGVRKVDANDVVTGTITSPTIQGYWTHWWNDRTVPHIVGEKLCKPCLKFIPMRWAGFIHLVGSGGGKGVFIELTQTARDRLLACTSKEEPLRGTIVSVSREGRRLRSPLVFQVLGRHHADEKLIRSPDILPTLERLWGLAESA